MLTRPAVLRAAHVTDGLGLILLPIEELFSLPFAMASISPLHRISIRMLFAVAPFFRHVLRSLDPMESSQRGNTAIWGLTMQLLPHLDAN